MSKERRLGRGLEALLGMNGEVPAAGPSPSAVRIDAARPDAAPADDATSEGLIRLRVEQVGPNPFQPRREFDEAEIDALAASLRTHGLIQPIAVRRCDGRYQLIAGERRLRAAVKAGWSEVPAKVIDADDRLAAELAIVENMQRKDLNPLEKAVSFRQYVERYGCTQEELASRLQLNRSTVANFIRLLELPADVQQAVREDRISYGHARALLPLGDDREQVALCRRIQDEGLSVRAVEDLVQDVVHAADESERPAGLDSPTPQPIGGRSKPTKSKTTASFEQQLKVALGTRVDVRSTARGRGKIVIHFANNAEFERLLTHLTGSYPRSAAG